MNKKVTFLLAGILILSIFTIEGMTTPVAAQQIKLKYACFPPAVTFPCVQMERWKAEVEKRTNGKVSVETFPGGTLLGAKDTFDGVIAGVGDLGVFTQAYQPGRFVITNAMSLPLQIPNARVGSLMVWDLFNKYKPEAFSKVKVLSVFTTSPSNIMSKVPVRSLNDLKGLPLRAPGSNAPIFNAWGATQVGMPMPETPEALQKGVVKGLFTSLEVMKDFKFAEICKYATFTNTIVFPFSVVMNIDKWNSLPKDVQKVMDDLSREHAEWTGNYNDEHTKEAIEWSKKTQNVEFIELTAAQKAKWNGLLEPIVAKWIADTKAKGFPAEQIVSDLKAFKKKYAGE